MRSRRHRTPTLILLLAVLVALAGCGGGGGGPPATEVSPPTVGTGPPGAGSGAPVTGSRSPAAGTVPTDTVTASEAPSGFGATDRAWLQLTIAMDERIIPVFDHLPERVDDPRLRALIRRFEASHHDTLPRLRALYGQSGGPARNPHEGHDMPGMATPAQLAAARRATGRAAAELFAELVRAHLDQSVRLARAEREHGVEPATRAVAAEIERTRADQRAQLDRLLPAAGTTTG
ncbi:DUF305 domain-containing protein [Plantactinospora sp. B24E8]|uniref:DUF305 domain-containing protein n=1 Tax=Plantactinospora sp. B24E8 TaxID=3153567 RepID=UPI00325EB4D8